MASKWSVGEQVLFIECETEENFNDFHSVSMNENNPKKTFFPCTKIR